MAVVAARPRPRPRPWHCLGAERAMASVARRRDAQSGLGWHGLARGTVHHSMVLGTVSPKMYIRIAAATV